MTQRFRNFDLTVDEIKLVRAIRDMSNALDNLLLSEQESDRARFFLHELGNLEKRLEDIRENTLIQ